MIVVLFGCNFKYINNISLEDPQTKLKESTYQSGYTITAVYNLSGKLDYKLISDHVNYFSKQNITCFDRPIIIFFNKNITPIWVIKSDKAKLMKNKIIYLYKNVKVKSLNDKSQVKYILTDSVTINLLNQDIFSDTKVVLYGINFCSSGMKMRGNLRKKTAELFEKVNTSYEIKNI